MPPKLRRKVKLDNLRHNRYRDMGKSFFTHFDMGLSRKRRRIGVLEQGDQNEAENPGPANGGDELR